MLYKDDFNHLREEIDKTDSKILALLCERAQLAHSIGQHKKKNKSPVYRPDREREVYRNIKQFLKENPASPMSSAALERIYREVMSASIAIEGGPLVAYLGPEASFSHAAMQSCFGSKGRSAPQKSISDVFRIVEAGQEADYGMVPIENTTEGAIGITLDNLLRSELKIYSEHYIPVHHHLLFHKKIKREKIRRVYSQRIAQEQCREWIHSRLNTTELEFVEMPSTAAAAQKAARAKDGAAIASQLAAQHYALEVIAENIQDSPNNTTRFLLIAKEQCQPTQDDKTSIVFSLSDKAGSLSKILNLFAKEDINLTKIESRSKRRNFGEYSFFIDFLGHSQEKYIRDILEKVRENSSSLKILGSYPRVDISV